MNIAKKIKDLYDFNGEAALYEMLPPLASVDYDDVVDSYQFVVVSAASVMFSGPETYIFPATPDGEVSDWGELTGSQRGTLSHELVLASIGYSIQDASVALLAHSPEVLRLS